MLGGSTYKTSIKPLEILQKKVLRIITLSNLKIKSI